MRSEEKLYINAKFLRRSFESECMSIETESTQRLRSDSWSLSVRTAMLFGSGNLLHHGWSGAASSYMKHWGPLVRAGQTGSDEVWKGGGVSETGPLCLLWFSVKYSVLPTIQIPALASWPGAKCVLPPGTNGLKEKRSGRRKNCLCISQKNRRRGWWEGSRGHWWECVCVSWVSVWE